MTEFDEKKFEHLVGHAWYDSYKYHFRHHPRCEYIVKSLIEDDLDQGTVDEYFAEADYYTAQHKALSNRV
jgi:hypothetical protein